MTWPSTPIPTTNLDSGTDSPAAARADLLGAVQAVNSMMTDPLPLAQVPAAALVPTGALLPYVGGTAPTGYVFANGMTIGSAASGATGRANADTSALFAQLWANTANTELAVSGGRGASAVADFAANKTITVPDMRGRTVAGTDTMGTTAAGRLQVSLTGTTTAGSAVITAISSTAALAVGMAVFGATMPAGATIASIDSGTQVTLVTGTGVTAGTATALRFGFMDPQAIAAAGGAHVQTLTTPQIPAHTHTLTGTNVSAVGAGAGNGIFNNSANLPLTSNSTGGGQAHSNVQPTLVAPWIIKL